MTIQYMAAVLEAALNSDIIKIVIVAVVADTVFGIGRAIRKRAFNSCFGIDGAIRKISMLVSIAFLLVIDRIMDFNLIGFIPGEVRQYLGITKIGTAEFFGLMYVAYELVSVLKNMTLCGLPVRGIWEKVDEWLRKYTKELPDKD